MWTNESTLPINRTLFASKLKAAIKSRGLTYEQAANLVKERIPEDSKLSSVSLWSYAVGKSAPRRPEIFQALCKVFDIEAKDVSVDPAALNIESIPKIAKTNSVGELSLMDAGGGLAFVQIAAAVEWDKALEIARILRRGHPSDDVAA